MAAYYNEIDPFAAAWLRELINAGHIAPGDVDTRSIVDVRPADLAGYTQCHFFAGIGVWSLALRRAGWADERPVWTGSCPCQPFSAAGKGGGFDDERHLWPAFFHLIGKRGPAVVFGEQVASKDADPWIDLVQADMEALGYAFGAVPFPSAGVGAPHIRDRTYWLADAGSRRLRWGYEHRGDVATAPQISGEVRQQRLRADGGTDGAIVGLADDTAGGRGKLRGEMGAGQVRHVDGSGDASGGMDDYDDARLEGQRGRHRAEIGQWEGSVRPASETSEFGGLVDADGSRAGTQPGNHRQAGEEAAGRTRPDDGPVVRDGASSFGRLADAAHIGRTDGRIGDGPAGQHVGAVDRTGGGSSLRDRAAGDRQASPGNEGAAGLRHGMERPGPTNGLWRDADWLFCRDGKWRPVEPGTFPLAHGAPARVGRLRGYGNAINAVAAETFITAYLEKDVVEIDAERVRLTGVFA